MNVKHKILLSINLVVLLFSLFLSYKSFVNASRKEGVKVVNKTVIDKVVVHDTLTISAVGDCTLGTDSRYGYTGSFLEVAEQNNYDFSYFFKGVKSVLGQDDLTIANMESVFTEATTRANKKFTFKRAIL